MSPTGVIRENGVSRDDLGCYSKKTDKSAPNKDSRCFLQARARNSYLAWDQKVPDSNMRNFQKYIEDKCGLRFASYWDLHAWTIDNTEAFWREVWDYFDIIASTRYDKVFVQTGPGFLDNEWFVGAKFNYAENLLRVRDNTIALTYVDEEGRREDLSFAQLHEEVRKYAAAFRKLGMKKGDVMCCHMVNRKEVVIALLASASIGATWGAIQPFYGAKTCSKMAERMQFDFLLTTDQYQRDGEITNVLEKIPTIIADVPNVKRVIIAATKPESLDLSHIRNSCLLRDIIESARSLDGSYPPLEFEQLPFDHPLFLNFTSGTTGLPKGPVHGTGNFVPLLLDVVLHWNLKAGDTLFTQFPPGWAVYNWFLPCLSRGVRLFLFDGSPLSPNFWGAASEASWMFIEPGMLDLMEKTGAIPGPEINLDSLKMMCICGSPVKVQNVKFVQREIKKNLFVGSLYGSTESYGFYSGFDLNSPLYGGEIQLPALGKDMKVLDQKGQSVVGELGELVLRGRSPSYPLRLFKDHDRSVLNSTYLDRYPGSWCPSDEAWVNPTTRGIVIVGRSDDVLVQHGECFGSADIYFAIHDLPEVRDYACVSQCRPDGDVRAVLFVQARGALTPELKQKIADKVRVELWEECVPEVILDVPDIPYNVNGKRMEGLVRKIVATNQIPQVLSIRNPDCLRYFCDRPEIVSYLQVP